MGLLSHISKSEPASKADDSKKEKAPAKKAGSGLLARASKSTGKTYSSFQEWAKGNGLEHCGIFSCIRGMMVITHAYGIDAQTVASSVSSKDFWKGTLKDGEDIINYSKDDQDFYNFLQFFSFEMKNNVSHITFVKLKGDDLSVLMIYNMNADKKINITENAVSNIPLENKYINYEFTQNNSKDIKQHEYELLTVNLSETVSSSVKTIQLPEASIEQAVIECVYNEIFDLLKTAFPAPNFVSYRDDAIVKIALVYNENLDDLLLQSHINLLLNEILCKQDENISLVNTGKTNDSDKVIDFLN
ncbi:MAG: hypothetical protein KBS84_09050 [Treponema sp.]|nr:hypothetical protein [Candidatus Treponema scatequi]